MNFLDGLKNFLHIIEANWTAILVCIGIIIGLVQRAKVFFKKSKEERIEIAKKQVRQTILEMVTKAEKDFADWNKAGEIKRSQVIKEIYDQYPILTKIIDQETVVAWIDEEINNSLKTLRAVVKENEKTDDVKDEKGEIVNDN